MNCIHALQTNPRTTKSRRCAPWYSVAVCLLVSAFICKADLTNGLMAYYPFDGNANDASEYGHHGTAINTVLTTNRFGQAGSAYRFDGVVESARVEINDTIFAGYRNFTMATWVLMEETSSVSTIILQTANAEIFYSPATDTFDLNLYRDRDGGESTRNFLCLRTNLDNLENNWHHLALVGFDSDEVKFYVDGVEVLLPAGGDGSQSSFHDFATIGAGRASWGLAYAFKGIIDDARIYNRALSGAEVQLLAAYSGGIPPGIAGQPNGLASTAGTVATFSVTATGSEPLSYQWRFNDANLSNGGRFSGVDTTTLTNSSVQVGDAGNYTVVVTNSYGSVTSSVAVLTLGQLGQTITFTDALNKTYGDSPFVLTATASSGLEVSYSSDNTSVATISGSTVTILGAGLANIIANQAGDATYSAALPVANTLTISKAMLTVTADNKSKTYGTDNPALTATIIGFVNGDTPAVVSGAPALSTTATLSSGVGTYPITAALGTLSAVNYDFSLVTGTLQVNEVPTPSVDSFAPDADGLVYSLAIQPDGKVLVGGDFWKLGGQTRKGIGRLNADGTLDSTFNPGAGGVVSSLAVQSDGRILVGGGFTTLGGQTRDYLARLNADGTLDVGFNPGADYWVSSMVVQTDGKILVGGWFTTLGGQARNRIARLNADGTLDNGFNPGASAPVRCLALQADGKILVGGHFTSSLGGQWRRYLGRLNADGTADIEFNSWAGDTVRSLAVQADGKILVGGWFTTLSGQPRNYLGRLNADGTLDFGFNPGANDWVSPLAVQVDGKILVGGNFTTLGGQSRNKLGRLNADGTLDSGFNPDGNDRVVSLAVQADGKTLVGGNFSTLSGQPRHSIGRLNNTEPATQSLSINDSTLTWSRGGPGPEAWRTTFESSINGTDWTSVGAGQRISGGWQLTNVSLAPWASIRARGYTTGGNDNASSWFVESQIQNTNTPPTIAQHPQSRTNAVGTTATFSVAASGSAPLSYQWRFNDAKLSNGGRISGVDTATLTNSSVQAGDAGNYTMVVTNSYGSVTSSVAVLAITQVAQTITFTDALNKAYGNVPFTLTATASSGMAVSYTSYTEMVATISGNTVTIVGAGLANIVANQSGDATYSAAPPATNLLTVSKATATVTVGNLSQTYDNTPKIASATTTPSGLSLTVTYDGSTSLPVNAGNYVVVATVTEINYAGSATNTLVIAKASQTITFDPVSIKTIGDAPFTLLAAASSDLPVHFASDNPAVATVSSNTVTLVGPGTANLTASQAGNSNYLAAASVVQPLTVLADKPTILSQPSSFIGYVGSIAPFVVQASGSGELAYYWLREGIALTNSVRVSGTDAASLLLSNLRIEDAGNYQVIVTATGGSITSQLAVLTVVLPATVVVWGDNTYGQMNVPAGLTNAAAVSAGASHIVSVLRDGRVLAWGDGSSGQTNVPADLTNAIAVAAGGSFSLAVRSNGRVAAWGYGGSGQTNVPASLTNAVAAAAGAAHGLALRADGRVTAWGLNTSGQTNVPATLSNVVAIAAGYDHSLALKADGTVTGWGSLTPFAGETGITAIAGGYNHCLALKSDGRVIGWGNNLHGQSVAPAGLSNVTAIVAGDRFSAVLRAGGLPVCWGLYGNGLTNPPSGLESAFALVAGNAFCAALTPAQAPVIVTNPVSQTVRAGTNVVLSITVTGTPRLRFQWQKDGTNLITATNSSLAFATVQTSDEGAYTVTVSNSFGGIISSPALMHVVPPPPGFPSATNWYATAGAPYSNQVTVTNGASGFAATGLPPGLVLDPLTGQITGTPLLRGSFTASLFATNEGGISSTMLAFGVTNTTPILLPSGSFAVSQSYPSPEVVGSGGYYDYFYFASELAARGARPTGGSLMMDVAPRYSTGRLKVLVEGQTVRDWFDFSGRSYLSYSSFTSSDLTDGEVELALLTPGYPYSVYYYGATLTVNYTANLQPSGTLAEAVDAPALAWSSGGDSAWYATRQQSHDGADAAVSAGLGNGQSSWLATSVAGPGRLRFWWKVSSEPGKDREEFTLNGSTLKNISGEVGWAQQSFDIPPGTNLLQWTYGKDSTGAAGYDMAWLDTVEFSPSNLWISAISNQTLPKNASTGPVPFQVADRDTPLDQLVVSAISSNTTLIPTANIVFSGVGDQRTVTVTPAAGQTGVTAVVVRVSDGSNTVSTAFNVLVVDSSPSILSQPSGGSRLAGENFTFQVVATGLEPLSFRWYRNGTPLADGEHLSGAATTSLSLSNLVVADSGSFQVVVTNLSGSVTSEVAILTVSSAPAFVTLGDLQHTYDGQPKAATATTTPAALPVAITYSGSSQVPVNAGSYAVIATITDPNYVGGATNTLTIAPAPQTITFDPLPPKVDGVDPFTLSAFASSDLPVTFSSDNASVAAVVGNLVTIVGPGTAGITASQSGDANHLPATPVSQTLHVASLAPSIVTQLQSAEVAAGHTAEFMVVAHGSAPLLYQWFFLGTNALPTATNSVLTLTNPQAVDAGSYHVAVRNAAGSVTSEVAILTVLMPPQILTQPQTQPLRLGQSVTFGVTATGAGPLNFCWYKNNQPLSDDTRMTGTTTSTLQISSLQVSDAGAYHVVVTNMAGTATSEVAQLAITPPPSITVQPVSRTPSLGDTVTFEVTATGTTPLSYQWQFNGQDIPGATGSTLTVQHVGLTNAGGYRVMISNAGGMVASQEVSLNLLSVQMYAGLTLRGRVGATCRIEISLLESGAPWTVLTNVVLPVGPYLWVDSGSANLPRRFYRAVPIE